MTEPTRLCGTCGMPCTSGEYHPYAACLMFKACHNSETVRANLEAVRATQAQAGAVPLTDEQWQRIADLTDSILTRATKDEIERVIGIKGGQHGESV